MTQSDRQHLERAIALAERAAEAGAPPVGAVVVVDGEIVGEGAFDGGATGVAAHAEMVAMAEVEASLGDGGEGFDLVATLEPCPACASALLARGVGRVVFGAADDRGGARALVGELAAHYGASDSFEWVGPVDSERCGSYARRALLALEQGPRRERPWSTPEEGAANRNPEALRSRLDRWLRDASADLTVQEARGAVDTLADDRDGDPEDLLPYAAAIFRRGGYLKDYRSLERHARRADRPDVLEEVRETLREELPDLWIRRALDRGDCELAAQRWFEAEGHSRRRHVADELVEACGRGRIQLLISCRLAVVSYRIERGGRRHYRRACTVLRKLRDELDRAGEIQFWRHVLADLRERYDNRPAFLDELDRADLD